MRFLMTVLIMIFLTSCSDYTEIKEGILSNSPGGFTPVTPGTPDTPKSLVDFAQIKKTIIDTSCIQCHLGYSNYQTVRGDVDNILSQVLTNRMPKNASPINDELKALLQEWVNDGAPEFVVSSDNNDSDIPDSTPQLPSELEATWESLSTNIIFPKCVSCHNANGQASFLPLSTRQDFFDGRDYLLNNFQDARSSYLIEVITDPEEPMPPLWAPFEQLTEEEVDILVEWIEKGLP